MKTVFHMMCATFVAMVFAVSPLQGAELIGLWDFSSTNAQTAKDQSAAKRDATLFLGESKDLGTKTALVLNGFSTHGMIPATRATTFSNGVTLTAWINPARLRRNNVIFGKPNSNPAWTTPTIGLFVPEEGRIGFGLWTQPKAVAVSPKPTPIGSWTFVAGSYDGETARLFVDGQLIATAKAGKKIAATDEPFLIGTGTMSNRFYAGMIGELRLYDGALDVVDVGRLYRESVSQYPREPQSAKTSEQTTTVRSKRRPDSEWRNYPTRTLGLLDGYEPSGADIELSKYGGWLARRTTATGYFRVEKIADRWWMIDPEGYYFIHVGVGSVHPGSSANMKKSFAQKFGSTQRWTEETAKLLKELRFNGTGGWSSNQSFRESPTPFPYIVRMNLMSRFGKHLGVTNRVPGHTGFELQCIPVFHPDFPQFCDEQAKELAASRDDPYVVGIYSDNELQAPILDNYLQLDQDKPSQKPNYEAALAWLQKRKGKQDVSASDITVMDRLEFGGFVFERYFSTVSQAIKKYAPNHLYIGSRFMGSNFANPFVWKAASPYCDVITINYYSVWGPDLHDVAYWQSICPRPLLVTEFYVKGEDSGLPNNTGAGWIVPTHQDRGRFYQHYVLGLLESRSCIGWHWFKYQDNDPEDTKAELSNIDSNKGIVDIKYEPYVEFTDLMREVNREVYPLTRYFDQRGQ